MSRASDLAERLMGTCDNLDMDEHEDFGAEEWAEFDSLVFCCSACGWWCEAGEMQDDGESCSDCAPEGEEEEGY